MVYLCCCNVLAKSICGEESRKIYDDITDFIKRMSAYKEFKTVAYIREEDVPEVLPYHTDNCITRYRDIMNIGIDTTDLIIVCGFHLEEDVYQICNTLFENGMNFILVPNACLGDEAHDTILRIMDTKYHRHILQCPVELSEVYRLGIH